MAWKLPLVKLVLHDMGDEFHLCQPEKLLAGVPSCASCCGIYNFHGHDREMITRNLEMQTDMMSKWDGTDNGIEAIRAKVEADRPPPRFSVIYNCPFAGFLDNEHTRVGCLLHPLLLGEDKRDHCRYGHRTCGEAKCTSYTYLDDGEGRAVMAAAPDWYIYGLSITDIDLVKDFFDLCEFALYGPVDASRVAKEPELARIFGEYLSFKENWPFATDPGRFGKYYFVEKNYYLYSINYREIGLGAPRHNGIMLSLASVIESKEDLEAALKIVNDKVEEFLEVYNRCSPKKSSAAGG